MLLLRLAAGHLSLHGNKPWQLTHPRRRGAFVAAVAATTLHALLTT